jgi:16S rRNA (guanine966-N2)-methyltransferase
MKIIAGTYRSRIIDVPKGGISRPTTSQVRASVFNICQGYIEGSHFGDLFAGSGAMGLEALSRGARFCTFIEQNHEACLCIKKNIDRLHVEDQCLLIRNNVHLALNRVQEPFDICYIDPPYDLSAIQILQELDQKPFLTEKAHVFYETRFHKSIAPTFDTLTNLVLASSRKIGDTMLYHFYKGQLP